MHRCHTCEYLQIEDDNEFVRARCKCNIKKKRVTKGKPLLEYSSKGLETLKYHIRVRKIAPYWCPLRQNEKGEKV